MKEVLLSFHRENYIASLLARSFQNRDISTRSIDCLCQYNLSMDPVKFFGENPVLFHPNRDISGCEIGALNLMRKIPDVQFYVLSVLDPLRKKRFSGLENVHLITGENLKDYIEKFVL